MLAIIGQRCIAGQRICFYRVHSSSFTAHGSDPRFQNQARREGDIRDVSRYSCTHILTNLGYGSGIES